jgi:hypothetical protein
LGGRRDQHPILCLVRGDNEACRVQAFDGHPARLGVYQEIERLACRGHLRRFADPEFIPGLQQCHRLGACGLGGGARDTSQEQRGDRDRPVILMKHPMTKDALAPKNAQPSFPD